jgi:hypothetical protein
MRLRMAVAVPGCVLIALVGVTAGPAWAHAVFQQKTVAKDVHTELVLNVPVEQHGQNSHIAVVLPDDFDVHSCTADEGWSCSVNNAKDPEHPEAPQVVFTRLGCTAESSYRCPNSAAPAAAEGPVAQGLPVSFARPLHEGEGGGDMPGGAEGGGTPGQSFRFLVHTPAKAGDYTIKVDQRYSTGDRVRWEGAQGSETPAPMIQVS